MVEYLSRVEIKILLVIRSVKAYRWHLILLAGVLCAVLTLAGGRRSFLRGQNVPLQAEILEERQRRREKALQHQTAIRQQLEERERRRREERERRQREERLEEERVRREQDEQRRRLEDEQRRLRDKEVGAHPYFMPSYRGHSTIT